MRTKGTATHFTLEKTGIKKTKFTLDFYIKKNLPSEITISPHRKKKAGKCF